MRAFLRIAALCSIPVLASSCGGGGAGSIPPASTGRSVPDASRDAQFRTGLPKYVAVPLPAGFVPSAIMSDGQIPGRSGQVAAIYRRGSIRTLGTLPGGAYSDAKFVNARGDAVGDSGGGPGASYEHAVLFSNGQVRDLGHLPDSPGQKHDFNVAEVIDARGDIYGYSTFGAVLGGFALVRFSRTQGPVMLSNVGTRPATGLIHNINSSGTYSVDEILSPPIGPWAAVGRRLSLTFLFGERASNADWVNNNGDIAGYIDPTDEPINQNLGVWTAFVRTRVATTLLPNLPESTSMQPAGINDRGDVVGTSGCIGEIALLCNNAFSDLTTFIYTARNMYDMKNLLPTLFTSAGSSALPGISEDGAFVAQTSTGYYMVKPSP